MTRVSASQRLIDSNSLQGILDLHDLASQFASFGHTFCEGGCDHSVLVLQLSFKLFFRFLLQ